AVPRAKLHLSGARDQRAIRADRQPVDPAAVAFDRDDCFAGDGVVKLHTIAALLAAFTRRTDRDQIRADHVDRVDRAERVDLADHLAAGDIPHPDAAIQPAAFGVDPACRDARSVEADRDSVDLRAVLEATDLLAAGSVPHADVAIPSARDNPPAVRREDHARYAIVVPGQRQERLPGRSVPQADRPVVAGGCNLVAHRAERQPGDAAAMPGDDQHFGQHRRVPGVDHGQRRGDNFFNGRLLLGDLRSERLFLYRRLFFDQWLLSG